MWLLYADDLTVMAEMEELLMVEKIQKWKEYGGKGTQNKLR